MKGLQTCGDKVQPLILSYNQNFLKKYVICHKCGMLFLVPTHSPLCDESPLTSRVSLTILSAQGTQNIPWDERDPRVFFRGRDSNQARLDLVSRHHMNTPLFDVGITAFFFFKHEEDKYGPIAKRVGFNEFFKVSYLK